MKKFIVILIALAMAISLFAGCGNTVAENVSGSVSQNAPVDSPADPAETPDEDVEATDENEAEFDTGFVIGGTYSNEFLGLNLTLDSNWVFFNEEQIAQLNGMTADLITDESIKEMLENSGTVYDLYASTLDNSCSINLVIENLGLLYGALLSEEAYIDAAIGTLATALESAGMTNIVCEKTSVELCGETHAAINVSGTNLYGIDVYETLVCYKVGNYMTCITFVALDKETSLELVDLFYTGDPVYVEAPAVPEADAANSEFSAGQINGYNYVNEFFGVICELDDSWHMYSTAEIANYNGLSSETYTTEDMVQLLNTVGTFVDMSAESLDNNYVIEIVWEYLGEEIGPTVTVNDYIDIVLPSVEDGYKASGFENITAEKVYIDFCGREELAIQVSATAGGLEFNQLIPCIKIGNYMAVLDFITLDGSNCTALIEYFSPIN